MVRPISPATQCQVRSVSFATYVRAYERTSRSLNATIPRIRRQPSPNKPSTSAYVRRIVFFRFDQWCQESSYVRPQPKSAGNGLRSRAEETEDKRETAWLVGRRQRQRGSLPTITGLYFQPNARTCGPEPRCETSFRLMIRRPMISWPIIGGHTSHIFESCFCFRLSSVQDRGAMPSLSHFFFSVDNGRERMVTFFFSLRAIYTVGRAIVVYCAKADYY